MVASGLGDTGSIGVVAVVTLRAFGHREAFSLAVITVVFDGALGDALAVVMEFGGLEISTVSDACLPIDIPFLTRITNTLCYANMINFITI
ncbi:MAG: hypothetical protein QF704_04260 [Anaerolineales bacterium]|nr:hypothetical protein [Anaerolineales bacterium]